MDIRIDTPKHPEDETADEGYIYAPFPGGEAGRDEAFHQGSPVSQAPHAGDDQQYGQPFPEDGAAEHEREQWDPESERPFVAPPYIDDADAAAQVARGENAGNVNISDGVHIDDPAFPQDGEDPCDEPQEEMVPKSEYDAAVDRYERLMADWDNYRRRSAEDVASAKKNANRNFAESLIPTLDHFNFALEHSQATDDPAVEGMYKGFEAIYRALVDSLSREGLIVIDPAPGSEFDMMENQAVESVPDTGMESERIVKVVQVGYKFNDYIIRPAMVAVAS